MTMMYRIVLFCYFFVFDMMSTGGGCRLFGSWVGWLEGDQSLMKGGKKKKDPADEVRCWGEVIVMMMIDDDDVDESWVEWETPTVCAMTF